MASDVDKLISTSNKKLKLDENNEKLSSDAVIILKEELIRQYGAELVDFMLSETRKYKDFNMANILLKQIIDVKKTFFPENIVSKNLNVDVFSDKLKEWSVTFDNISKDVKNKEVTKMEEEIKQIDINDGR